MNKEYIKQEILSQIEVEINQWLETSSSIKDGYDYEDKFMLVSQKINKIILTKSLGEPPKDRNKKNSRRVLGR